MKYFSSISFGECEKKKRTLVTNHIKKRTVETEKKKEKYSWSTLHEVQDNKDRVFVFLDLLLEKSLMGQEFHIQCHKNKQKKKIKISTFI